MLATIISYQPELSQPLPDISGHANYRDFRSLLERIDELIVRGNLDSSLIEYALKHAYEEAENESLINGKRFQGLSNLASQRIIKTAMHALRCVRCDV